MAFTNGEKSLSKENILKRLDSYQLFKAYCPGFKKIGVGFSSEFRKDNDPSCYIIVWEGDLLYKDFGDTSYRIFDYIARKFNTDYQGALKIVNRDFNLQLGHNSTLCQTSLVIPEKLDESLDKYERKPTVIDIKERPWTKLDKQYWAQYSIPLKLLEYHNIKSISNYRISSQKKDKAYYGLNQFMIGYSIDYYWNEGVFRRKLYFPQVKGKGRFISNVDTTIVQGWTLLPQRSRILFVTKSYKDILIFNLLGYWAIAPNNEGAYIPEPVMDKLKRRFDNIFVWFDNDEGGINGAKTFSSKFNLKMTHNPVGEPKDPSDYVKKYSLSTFDKLVTNFLKYAYR
jgi:lipopolysaccharide biosynthesis glycosyltransferase